MEYIVKDKLMFERVIGMEFLEPSEKSIFYNGNDPLDQACCTFLFVYMCVHIMSVCISHRRWGSLLQWRAVLWKWGHTADLWHFVFLCCRPWISEFCACSRAYIRTANGQYLLCTQYVAFAVLKGHVLKKPSHSLQIFRLIRNTLGRKNLVNKTLVDERFLIWNFLLSNW